MPLYCKFLVISWLNDCEDMKLVVPTHIVLYMYMTHIYMTIYITIYIYVNICIYIIYICDSKSWKLKSVLI